MREGGHGTSALGLVSARTSHSEPGPTSTVGPPEPRRTSARPSATAVRRWYAPRTRASPETEASASSALCASGRSSAARERRAASSGASTAALTIPIRLATAHDVMMPSTMAVHREEGRFVIRLELFAEFDDEYEGDDDGNAWLEDWRVAIRPRVVRAVFDALRADKRFEAVPVSRGAAPEDEIEIAVRFKGREPEGTA